MKFVQFDDSTLGLLSGNGVIDLTSRLGLSSNEPLKEYIVGGLSVDQFDFDEPDYKLDEVSLDAPIRRPNKIIAAAGNYVNHIGEVGEEYVHPDQRTREDEIRYFLKAPSSITGPESEIQLPLSNRRCDHELELAFIMGKPVKDVEPSDVWRNIFGYTILLDISVRGKEDRSSRKSYDTFTPLGPYVVTQDDIDDPHDLDMELLVNGEVRQRSNTKLMIHTCAEVVANASTGTTIEPGDVITTGTPSGVGPLSDGDDIEATIENIGTMNLNVRERSHRSEDASNE